VFGKAWRGENAALLLKAAERVAPNARRKARHMLPLILILLLLAIVFGGFFVFSLKVAVVVAIVLLIAGMFGGYGYRGRRTV
jgi:hypothetical protein